MDQSTILVRKTFTQKSTEIINFYKNIVTINKRYLYGIRSKPSKIIAEI